MQLPVIRPQPGSQFHMVPHATPLAGVQQLSTPNSGGTPMMFQSIIQVSYFWVISTKFQQT